MTETDLKRKAAQTLAGWHTAAKNTRRDGTAFSGALEILYLHLLESMRQDDSAAYAEWEKHVQVSPSEQKHAEAAVAMLADVLLGLGIRKISFDAMPAGDEPCIFIHLPAQESRVAQRADQASASTPEKREAGTRADDRVYVKMEGNQITVSEMEVDENRIIESVADMQKIFNRLREMDGTIASFLFEEQKDLVRRLSKQVVEWVENQTEATPVFRQICRDLQALLQDFIIYGLLAEANPIIDVFSRMNTGELKKNDSMREISFEILQDLATERNIHILFEEININEKNKTTDACRILCGFGDIVVKKLLNMVRNATESKERIRFIHIIQEMGRITVPSIRESMTIDAPWYYLRNMAYLLGRVGDEDSIDALRPLMRYKDKRVRMEAFKSVSLIGGSKKGPFLLSVLPEIDPELRIHIIELLGKIKHAEAVEDLYDMLKSKSTLSKEYQISMQEKICGALGSIGSLEAIRILTEIADSKSFLGIPSYPTEVKYAAKRALEYLKRK